MLCAAYHKECSENGQRLGISKSAIQKYIRRGEEEKALMIGREISSYWLLEDDSAVSRVKTNLMNRLKIIYMEDVGIGNYHIWGWMIEKMDQMKQATCRDQVEVILEEVIRVLCRSRKTRLCSYLKVIADDTFRLSEIDADADAEEGIASAAEIREFEEAKSEEALFKGLRRSLDRKSPLSGGYLAKLFRLCNGAAKKFSMLDGILGLYVNLKCSAAWKELRKNKDGILLYMMPLAYYLYGSEEKLLVDKEALIGRLPEMGWVGELDEYVFDKHVAGGSGGKTDAYFALESSVVCNESYRYPLILKKMYQWIKCEMKGSVADYCKESPEGKPKAEEVQVQVQAEAKKGQFKVKLNIKAPWPQVFPERESEYEFISRVQLTCSDSKTDTVYGKYAGRVWFIKGPYENESDVQQFIDLQEEKRARGMPVFRSKCVFMYPDRWDKVPLGVRNRLDNSKKWPFLWCESIVEESEMVREVKGGKLWPMTEVVSMPWKVNVFELKGQELEDYLLSIRWRMERNVGDFGDRNFMRIRGRVYSVDEERKRSGAVSMLNNLKKRKYEYVMAKLKERGF